MDKKLLIVLLFVLISNGMSASWESDEKYLMPKAKQYPKRSSLFEPDFMIEEEQDLFLEDFSQNENIEDSHDVVPAQGNSYYSKSKLPWVFGTFKQRDALLSGVHEAIMEDDHHKLTHLLKNQNFAKITKFDDNPLVTAVLFHQTSMIAPLAVAGADVNMKDAQGDDIIKLAYKISTSAMVQELLKAQKAQMIRSGKLSPVRIASVSPYLFDENSDK